MTVEKLITDVFQSRDAAQATHWKTDSYSQHKALGHFYADSVDILDRFVETYQGLFGLVGDLKMEQDKPADYLRKKVEWLLDNREATCKCVPSLENIYDELVELHLKTIYKLEHLR